MEDRHREVLAVAALFFVLSWLAVSLRVYVRRYIMNTWGKDDSYMVVTLVSFIILHVVPESKQRSQLVFTVYLSFQTVAAVHGTGRHRWNLRDEDARIALMVSGREGHVQQI